MKSILSKAFCVCVLGIGISGSVNATVINAYFGFNFVAGNSGTFPVTGFELDLLDITYVGESGSTWTTAMPVFPGFFDNGTFKARTGLPDLEGFSPTPTYTTTVGGDGETTRTIGQTVPIRWDTTGAFPQISITDITVDTAAFDGPWTLRFSDPYLVGLIPGGPNDELTSSLAIPQGDIYNGLLGAVGNPVGTAIVILTPPGFEQFAGAAFGEFVFAAAVPIPAAAWLFGSGLLGLIGIARRKKAA